MLSPSSISLYLRCPYAYKLQYVDNIKTKEEVKMLEIGKLIHSILYNFYDKVNPKLSSFEFDKILNELLIEKLEKLEKQKLSQLLTSVDELKFILQKFAFYEKHRWLNKHPKERIPDFRELELSSEELGLKGVIDRVHIIGRDLVDVIDYKTSKHKTLYEDMNIQAGVYALLLKAVKNYDVKNFYFYFLRFDKSNIIRVSLTNSFLQRVKRIIEEVKEGIKEGKFEKKGRPESNCWFCSYRSYCRGYPIL